jgi:hypothetical protein
LRTSPRRRASKRSTHANDQRTIETNEVVRAPSAAFLVGFAAPVYDPIAVTDETFEIAFSPPSAGWINITLRGPAGRFVESFSYIRPSLVDLCNALADLVSGRTPRAVAFALEPDEFDLSFEPIGTRTTLRVLGYRDRRRGIDVDGSVILTHEADTRELVAAFARALQQLEASMPAEEFTRAWRSAFPASELRALERLSAS